MGAFLSSKMGWQIFLGLVLFTGDTDERVLSLLVISSVLAIYAISFMSNVIFGHVMDSCSFPR